MAVAHTDRIPACTARHASMEGQAILLAASLFLGCTIVEAQVQGPVAAPPPAVAVQACYRVDWPEPESPLALQDQPQP